MFMLPKQRGQIRHLAFSPSGLTLAAVSYADSSLITIWDLLERSPVEIPVSGGGIVKPTFIRDDATLVTTSLHDQRLLLVDIPTGQAQSLLATGDNSLLLWFGVGEDGDTVFAVFLSMLSQ